MKKIVLLIVSLPFLFNAYSQNSTNSEKENAELVKSYFYELNDTGSDELVAFVDKYISSDIVVHLPGEEINSKEGVVKHYEESKAAMPGGKQTINDIITQGDKVVFRGVLKAILPNENEITVTFAGFWQVKDGKIVEWWSEYDALGMMQQMGMELRMKE